LKINNVLEKAKEVRSAPMVVVNSLIVFVALEYQAREKLKE
jgi:hypothetical protein|tara:strand:- start:5507 stop:5629 length:123 start_codon:yes stop_codon:yes gene_type:complete